MIALPSGVRVWIAAGHSDMRRGMHSLALQVQEVLKRNPHAGDLYVFRGRSGSLIKILWHDGMADVPADRPPQSRYPEILPRSLFAGAAVNSSCREQ